VDRKGGWAYLKCPNCSNRSRMKILINTTDKKPSVRFHKRCKLLLADSTEGDKQMSDVEGKPDTLRVRIRTERGFDKEYDLLEDKILARFQKKREDVKSVTWSDNIGGSLYTELGVASPYHPLIGSGSASIEFRDGTYTRICDVFYQDFNQKRTHYDGLPHWNHERRFEMPSRVEWDKNPGETHGIDKSLWIEVYVSNTCGNQFKRRAYWQALQRWTGRDLNPRPSGLLGFALQTGRSSAPERVCQTELPAQSFKWRLASD
jgi:hypothetical protein